MVTGLHPWCPLPPHPNPPPRRGEGRVGVMFLMFFLQCLGKVIVEIKAERQLVEENEAQLLNYLKATAMEVGLLLNFGPKPEVRRKAFDNLRK